MINLIALYKTAKYLLKNKEIAPIMLSISKLAEEVKEDQKPRFQRILSIRSDGYLGGFASVWIGCGNITPIDRISHLRNQNTEYKRLLQESLKSDLPKELRQQIELTIRTFEL